MTQHHRLGDLVGRFGGRLVGDADIRVTGFAPLQLAQSGQLAFLSDPKRRSELSTTRAAAVLLRDSDATGTPPQGGTRMWVCDNPYLMFARVSQFITAFAQPPAPVGISPGAFVDARASVHPEAWIAPGAVVEAGASVGARSRIGAGSVVCAEASVGPDSLLHPRVVLYPRSQIGARCILHSGVVIGADGFGFARDGEQWVKIPQTGRVVIGDDVEIGANTTIDCGALSDTIIGNGVKLDNQIQIGHNVRIGDHTAMAACTGVAGSAEIGRGCTVGGGARILGHLTIADGVNVSAATVVTHSLRQPGHYTGFFPLSENAAWEKSAAVVRRLPELRSRIRQLERRLDEASTVTEPQAPQVAGRVSSPSSK